MESQRNPLDLNGTTFDPDLYLRRVLKEEALNDLIEHEAEMVQQIRSLDSDMQTLVYENYNKFITATDTIRQMKQDFNQMETEMDKLATNMSAINHFSGKVSSALHPNRMKIQKLTETLTIVRKLQFLYDLPVKLTKCLEARNYAPAVKAYCKVQGVLESYSHLPSFQQIHKDCIDIMQSIKKELYAKFRTKSSTTKELAECIELFTLLKEPPEILCQEFLGHAEIRLKDDLDALVEQVDLWVDPASRLEAVDIMSFVDMGSNGFLSNVCLVVASYNDMFVSRHQSTIDEEDADEQAKRKLIGFVSTLMQQYFDCTKKRFLSESILSSSCETYARALDRFSRRLQAIDRLVTETDYSRVGFKLVQEASTQRCQQYLVYLNEEIENSLNEAKEAVTQKPVNLDGNQKHLLAVVQKVHARLMERIKFAEADLRAFIQPDVMFANIGAFHDHFCRIDVRDNLITHHIRDLLTRCEEFCESGSEKCSSPTLLMILSRHVLDLQQSTIGYIFSLTKEQFPLNDRVSSSHPPSLIHRAKEVSQKLINAFVHKEGLAVSQMIRKGVETRDWLSTSEPRTVRAVVKRVVEELTVIDQHVGQLYEEGSRKDGGSNSSRRTRPSAIRSQTRSAKWTTDTSLLSNIQKLFSERVDYFSDVEFSKVSILTGIVKIALKTFLECVRLRTFGKYGLQQVQVDCHYLQQYLWRFVSDENLVRLLIDEIVSSTVQRCIDPVEMEPSVIEAICDRG